MGWPRILRRRDPHTALITGVKSALRAGDETSIVRLLSRYGRALSLDPRFSKTLSHVLTGRVGGGLSHADASTALSDLAHQLPALPATTWFTLENLSRAIGCFHASHAFTTRGFHQITHTPARNDHDTTRHFLAHLHQRNLDAASHTWTTRQPTPHTRDFWADAGHYLWLWSRHHTGQPHWSTDPNWTTTLTGHTITILGPAPTSLTPTHTTPHLTARVIMQDVLNWDDPTDPLSGRCELAYASRETRNWIRDNNLWSRLERFEIVSFRVDQVRQRWDELGSGNLRSAHNPRALMLGGSSPNMVPLMVWDILRFPETTLTVAGTTFFASATAYTPGNRRFKHTLGKDTDETGGTGELFERCPTFARHNVVENLTLVANLAQTGSIEVDEQCGRVISLGVEEYLSELDVLYGVDRR